MASFTNPEKEGREWGTWQENALKGSAQQETNKQKIARLITEATTAPTGFGAPRAPPVSAHGPLYSGWVPNPERVVSSVPWLQVDCCSRWPAHNESYINALCGHRIHECCISNINKPYAIDACPICTSHATHYEREGESYRLFTVDILHCFNRLLYGSSKMRHILVIPSTIYTIVFK